MKTLFEIRKEAEEECLKDNCYSWPVICLVAMEKAINEYKNDLYNKMEDIVIDKQKTYL